MPSRRLIPSILAALALWSPLATADIYQWEWINPNIPGFGRQQSNILAPDGERVEAAPSADLRDLDLTMAWLRDADLSASDFTNTILEDTDLTGANLSGAIVLGTDLSSAVDYGLTSAQSTRPGATKRAIYLELT